MKDLVGLSTSENKEHRCPTCHKDNVDCTDSYDLESWPIISIPMKCLDCDCIWWETHEAIYKPELTHIDAEGDPA